jgi:hypothetical protein
MQARAFQAEGASDISQCEMAAVQRFNTSKINVVDPLSSTPSRFENPETSA